MKKVLFTTISIIAVAAMMLVSCKKDNGTDENKKPTVDPVEEYTGPVEGTENWAIIGTILGANWDKDYKAASAAENIYVVKNVKLEAGNEFKWRDTSSGNGGWDVNRGGAYAALGEAFDVVNNGANIKPELDGIYDIYLNLAVDQAAIVAKDGAQPEWKELPKAMNWDYVYAMDDYYTNGIIKFGDGNAIKVSPTNVTLEIKFLATKWNSYRNDNYATSQQFPDGNTYKLRCNRLGKFGAGDDCALFRFSNQTRTNGELMLNAGVLGQGQATVAAGYAWAANEWHTLTVVGDGQTLKVYDNGVEKQSWNVDASNLEDEWAIDGLVFSEDMNDGAEHVFGQTFFGYLAYMRIWNKALTAEEINAGLCDVAFDSEGLVAYWGFNNAEGTEIVDVAGGHNFDLANLTKSLDKTKVVESVEGSWSPVADEEKPIAAVCKAEAGE